MFSATVPTAVPQALPTLEYPCHAAITDKWPELSEEYDRLTQSAAQRHSSAATAWVVSSDRRGVVRDSYDDSAPGIGAKVIDRTHNLPSWPIVVARLEVLRVNHVGGLLIGQAVLAIANADGSISRLHYPSGMPVRD